jgi:hypothetical protein
MLKHHTSKQVIELEKSEDVKYNLDSLKYELCEECFYSPQYGAFNNDWLQIKHIRSVSIAKNIDWVMTYNKFLTSKLFREMFFNENFRHIASYMYLNNPNCDVSTALEISKHFGIDVVKFAPKNIRILIYLSSLNSKSNWLAKSLIDYKTHRQIKLLMYKNKISVILRYAKF